MYVCVCARVVFINCSQFVDINLRNKFLRRTQTKESETASEGEIDRERARETEKHFRSSASQIFNEY